MRIVLLITLLGLTFGPAQAQISERIHFQGVFQDAAGAPLADGTYSATFKLCRSQTLCEGNNFIWSETKNVSLSDGVLSVELGTSISTSLADVPFNDEYWLETTLDGTTYPRQRVAAAPYARYADRARLALPLNQSSDDDRPLKIRKTSTDVSGSAIQGIAEHGVGVLGYTSQPGYTTSFGIESDSIGVAGYNTITTGTGIGIYGATSGTTGYAGYFWGGQGVVLDGGFVDDNGKLRSEPGEASSDLVFYTNDDLAIHLDENDDETGQFTIVDGADVAIFAVREDGIITTDLILDGSGDNGNIRSNPDDPDSDLVLYTNDILSFHLDDNADQTNSHFSIVNGGNDEVFRVSEDGTVRVEGTTVHTSDRNRKEAFRPVDTRAVLEHVAAMPMMEWAYKGQSVRHLGPMAQDFYAAFGLGQDEKTIAAVDADGVALAAIQALHQQNQDLKRANDDLLRRLERLEALVGGQ